MPAIALSVAALLLCGALTGCTEERRPPPTPAAPDYEPLDLDPFDQRGRPPRETVPI